jgi:predicted RNase H-like HicB family nuclease
MVYRVVVEKGEDFGYVVHCPAIPGCHSQGHTIEEAIRAFSKSGLDY